MKTFLELELGRGVMTSEVRDEGLGLIMSAVSMSRDAFFSRGDGDVIMRLLWLEAPYSGGRQGAQEGLAFRRYVMNCAKRSLYVTDGYEVFSDYVVFFHTSDAIFCM